jgi:hypothetical protein
VDARPPLRDSDRYASTRGGLDRLIAELRDPRPRRPEPGEIVRTALGIPVYVLVNACIFVAYGVVFWAVLLLGVTFLLP